MRLLLQFIVFLDYRVVWARSVCERAENDWAPLPGWAFTFAPLLLLLLTYCSSQRELIKCAAILSSRTNEGPAENRNGNQTEPVKLFPLKLLTYFYYTDDGRRGRRRRSREASWPSGEIENE